MLGALPPCPSNVPGWHGTYCHMCNMYDMVITFQTGSLYEHKSAVHVHGF
jgi:hypothetical protein